MWGVEWTWFTRRWLALFARRVAMASALLGGLAGGACRDRAHFSEPLLLAGGIQVSPDVLDEGRSQYGLYCARCHGENGDGRGPASAGMSPPPRDLTQGVFKVAADELPDDDDLVDVLRSGIAGTRMPPFRIPEGECRAIVQFLKTMSPRWRTESPRSARPVSKRP